MEDDAGAESAPAAVDDGPLSARLESKAWKTRMDAYEELTKLFESSEDDSAFEEFASVLPKAVADSNVNAQEKAIEAAHVFARKASSPLVARYASSIIGKAIEKAAGQAKCKAKVQELALHLIEAEAGEVVAEELIKGCAHKQPKIAGVCAETLRTAVDAFGLRPLGAQSKAIVKLTVTMFDSTVAPVRAEAKNLAVEIYKYMGAALRPSYENLRPAQQKELDEAFAAAGQAQPSRMTRSAAAKAASAPAPAASSSKTAGSTSGASSSHPADVDPLEFLDPVEVLAKLPGGWCEKVLAAPKWQEKKELLDVLIDLAKSPKLASGDYSEVVKTLKRLMGDSMVLVVSTAITAFSMLANGLRKEFKQCAQISVATLLDKFKEKDKRVIEAIHTALDAIYGRCLSLIDFSEDLMTALGPKGGAKAKVEVLKFMKRAIDSKVASVVLKNVKPLVDFVVKTTDDSTPEIRDGACAVLSALISASGLPAMKIFLEGLDEKKRKKIESMSENNQACSDTQVSDVEGAAPTAPALISKAVAPKKATAVVASSAPSKPDVVDAPAKKVPVKSAPPAGKAQASAKSVNSTKPSTQGKEDAESDVNAGTSLEELDALAEEHVPAAIRSKFSSTNWKERLEGLEEFDADIKIRVEGLQHPIPEAITRLFVKSFVDKKETNFQVMAKVISLFSLFAEKSPKFSKRAAFWTIPILVEKLGDVKLRSPSHDCLLVISEAVTPQFVLTQAYDAIGKQKSPKTQENALLWVNAVAVDFGFRVVKAKPVLELVKSMLEVANPGVKKAAVEVLVTMRRQLGPDVRGMVSDVKPALLATIDEAFAKVADEAPADGPKRQVKGAEGSDAVSEENQIVNLTTPISAHLKALGDANWKERQAAITAIEDVIVKAKPLGCTGVYMDSSCGELWAGLKARLKDSNKNLATQVLALLVRIADAVGPAIDRYSKAILPNMLALIADNKKTVRDAVLASLSAWSVHVPSETVIKHLPVALTVDAPAGREDAVKWAADYLTRINKSTGLDISPILPAVMECLEHRVAEIRSGAERCLAAVIACGGLDAVNRCLRDLKPATLKTLRPICDKAERAAAALVGNQQLAAPVSKSDAAGASEQAALAPAAIKPHAREVPLQERESSAPSAARKDPVAAPSSTSGPVKKVLPAASKQAPEPPEPQEDADSDGPRALRCNTGKEAREKQQGKAKWVFDDAREAEMLLEALDRQMYAVCSEEIHAKLFNKDFKRQVDGIRDLVAFSSQYPKELMDNMDLILKMCALRMTGKAANTTLVLAVLELLRAAFEVLVSHDYRLSDLEASVCFPVLMEEVGSNNDGVRKLIRDLLRKATQVYPTSKIFSFLIDAAHVTRNQRSRAECLSEMAALIERLGLDQVCVPSKAVPVIATYVAERDAIVRNNAIDCIVAAYQSSGDKVSKYLTKLEPKDKDILDAKLRKAKANPLSCLSTSDVTRGVSSPKPSKNAEMRASLPEASVAALRVAAQDPMRSSLSSVETPPKMPRSAINDLLDAPTPSISNIKSRFHVSAAAVPPSAAAAAPPTQEELEPVEPPPDLPDLRQCLEELESPELEVRVQAMKDVALHIEQQARQPRGGRCALGREADALVTLLRRVIADGAACSFQGGTARSVKYALHAGHQLFSTLPDIAATVPQATVGRLMEELLLLASSEAGKSQDEDMQVLSRGTEELIMDVLGGADPNAVFTTLIRFLYEGACLSDGQEAPADMVSNVLRCLMEMTRRMSSCAGALRVDTLLYDAHLFLVAHPPSKYRGREFRPLRLLKTILNELVKLRGESIRNHLSLVPVESKPTLCSYLDLVLQQHAAAQAAGRAPAVPGPAPAPDSVAAIFERIGSKDKEAAKEGFRMLHAYRRGHSDFSLEEHLAGHSAQFQEHVHKSLAKVQAQMDGSGPDIPVGGAPAHGGGGSVPLQNAMSSANRAASATTAAAAVVGQAAAAITPAGCPQAPVSAGGPGAGGGLLDKLHGIRSQLGIVPPAVSALAGMGRTVPGGEEERAAPAPSAAPAVISTSVLSLQERLARLKNS